MKSVKLTWLIPFVLVLAGAGVLLRLLAGGAERSRVSEYSSYRADPKGARAFHSLAGRMGKRVRRSHERLYVLDGVGTLFLLEPGSPLSEKEGRTVLDWVRGGGTLVLATEKRWKIPDALKVEVKTDSSVLSSPCLPSQVSLYALGVGTLALSSETVLEGKGPWIELFRQGGKARVGLVILRRGRILLLSDAYPLSNGGIGEAGNPAFAVNLLRSLPEGEILFDEYHHGYRFERTLVGYLKRRNLHFAALQLLLVSLLLLYREGRRLGPERPPRPPPARESSEYVEALSRIYLKTGARGEALRALRLDLLHTLSRRAGGGQPDEVRRYLEALGGKAPGRLLGALEASARLEGGGKISGDEFVRQVREMEEARRAFFTRKGRGMRNGN